MLHLYLHVCEANICLMFDILKWLRCRTLAELVTEQLVKTEQLTAAPKHSDEEEEASLYK